MSYAASRSELLAARDRRHEALLRALAGGRTTLSLALNLPGADKLPPGANGLYHWARLELARALPDLGEVEQGLDPLGPHALFVTSLEPAAAKGRCVAIESAAPYARLVDLDVYGADGRPVDRQRLGIPQRPCLLCARPARECIRLGRHHPGEIARRIHELLVPFTG